MMKILQNKRLCKNYSSYWQRLWINSLKKIWLPTQTNVSEQNRIEFFEVNNISIILSGAAQLRQRR